MSVIETKKLKKHFHGVKAVDQLSIKIEKGKVTSLLGPNGSGKTTVINLLSGFLPMDGGKVVINNVELEKIKAHQIKAYGITRTFQNIRLFEQMTVMDNLLVVLTERNIVAALFEQHKKLHQNRAKEILERIGLLDKRNQLAANLSYGQRKLLEIGRALAMDADIYLLDEPFAGLFPEMVKIISSVIKDLSQQGKTIILIEHNMNIIRELSDYLIVMDEGKLLADGEPKKVLSQPEVIEAYLGD